MLSMRTAIGNEACGLAEIALKHELYIPGWTLCRLLTRILENPKPNDAVAIILRDEEAISVAILTDGSDTVAAYTKPEVRKNGFGRAALMGLRLICGKQFCGHTSGAEGSVEFFQKCGLTIDFWSGY